MKCIEIKSYTDLIGQKSYLRLPRYIDRVIILDPLREKIIEQAKELLLRNQNVLITGDAGVGKTTLLYFIWRKISSEGGIKTCYVPYNADRIPEFDGVIILDDLLANYRNILHTILNVRMGTILATARRGELSEIVDIFRAHGVDINNVFRILEIKPFVDRTLIGEIFLRHINESGLILDSRHDKIIIDQVIEKSEGYPVYIYMLVNDAISEGRKRITLSLINSVPKGLFRYVEMAIQRIISGIPISMDKAAVLNSALLSLYIMAKYAIGGVHIDLIHGLSLIHI